MKLFLALFPALWRYRGFVISMVVREFRGRYLGSLFGSLWSIINPLAMIIIYTVIFSRLMRTRLAVSDDPLAYSLFLCSGLLTWSYFAELFGRCQSILIEQGNLLKKVSFPRITLPMIVLFSSTVNFLIIFGIFSAFLLVTGRFPGWSIIAFFPLLLIQQSFALGFGILLGTLNVFFRDVGHFVGIVLQFWFWLTPIVYPISILPDRVRTLIALNPMTELIAAYQEIVLYDRWPLWSKFGVHFILAIASILAGFAIFRKLSAELVDEL